MEEYLAALAASSNLRTLPMLHHDGKWMEADGRRMLNLSSNDYLGLAADVNLRKDFLEQLTPETFLPTSSSARLLTGNFEVYDELETLLANVYGTESALVFNSGYHANTGILPAVCNEQTLILADKLVHASLIDGIRLSAAKCIRFQHNDYAQLKRLLEKYHSDYKQIIIATESIFSMDGDMADLCRLVDFKKQYDHVRLYVDEAHGVGVRGKNGLGLAEELNCIADIDFLVGTFGKALASVGAFVVCRKVVRDYLINRMRTFIFTTALPPVCIAWTLFVMKHLSGFSDRRLHLEQISKQVREAVFKKGITCTSASHIVPLLAGESALAMEQAGQLQRKGFYCLPVRPPTVPQGTSRIRFSLTAALSDEDVSAFINAIKEL